MLDLLIHRFPGYRVEEIQLCSIVPGHRSTIITMEDVGGFPVSQIPSPECNCSITTVVVVVFELNLNVGIWGKIWTIIGV